MYKVIDLHIKYLQVLGDSEIIVKKVKNTIHFHFGHLKHYQSLVQDLTSHLLAFNLSSVPRIQNPSVDLLANVASKLIPSQEFSPDRFYIELIFRPYVPNNITNWRVFNHDSSIIYFLTSKGSYDNQLLDEHEHDI